MPFIQIGHRLMNTEHIIMLAPSPTYVGQTEIFTSTMDKPMVVTMPMDEVRRIITEAVTAEQEELASYQANRMVEAISEELVTSDDGIRYIRVLMRHE